MINDEIIHIIGLREMVDFVVPFGAVATVYRQDLCLNKSFRQNENWFKTVMDFYARWHAAGQLADPSTLFNFSYLSYGDPETVKTAVRDAADAAETWILPVLDRVQTLKDVQDFYSHTAPLKAEDEEELARCKDHNLKLLRRYGVCQ